MNSCLRVTELNTTDSLPPCPRHCVENENTVCRRRDTEKQDTTEQKEINTWMSNSRALLNH